MEDNVDNQEIVKELLELESHDVFIANHGKEAIEFLRESVVDVLLMDCQMPIMNGYDAARSIRDDLGDRLTPIFAMTGNTGAEDRSRALDSGMNGVIPKPIDPDFLFGKLATLTSSS